jgi:hypothetical protein
MGKGRIGRGHYILGHDICEKFMGLLTIDGILHSCERKKLGVLRRNKKAS